MNYSGHPGFGSHLPILMKVIGLSDGPVLELGMGMFSTPFLHWACFDKQRRLVSLEKDPECFYLNRHYRADFHELRLVEDWDKADLSGHWGVVLIDHERDRRIHEARRLANSADYILMHDSEGRRDKNYKYTQIYPLFKYRYDYAKIIPFTVVLSNFKDLRNLCN